MPALNKARGKAYGISCVSNQKQIGTAYNMYTGDNAEYEAERMESPASPIYVRLEVRTICTRLTITSIGLN